MSPKGKPNPALTRALARIAASQVQIEKAIGELSIVGQVEDWPYFSVGAQRDELQRIRGRLEGVGQTLGQIHDSASIIERADGGK